jgi:hypothetical protein
LWGGHSRLKIKKMSWTIIVDQQSDVDIVEKNSIDNENEEVLEEEEEQYDDDDDKEQRLIDNKKFQIEFDISNANASVLMTWTTELKNKYVPVSIIFNIVILF